VEGRARAPPPLRHNRGLRSRAEIDVLRRAKERLDPLALYPQPVRIDGVRIRVAPWLFKIPGFRRFRGYATRHNIWLKRQRLDERLVTHELCHVWQLQHEPLRVWLSYARPSTFSSDRSAYRANRYEAEATRAAASVRS
jgi:hypothetical protein